MLKRRFLSLLIAFSFFAISAFLYCSKGTESTNYQSPLKTEKITATIETEPVSALQDDDAADDPAIWINFREPGKSLVLGTNKKAGLNLYNLQGEEVFFIPEGRINNVDLRYGFDLNGQKIDIAAGSNRSKNSISLHIIDGESRTLAPVYARDIISEVDEVYGTCMYHSRKTNDYYVFVNGKMGQIEQWKLFPTENNKIDAEVVRVLSVSSQPEGMVADDENAVLFVGEEGNGIWKFDAEPDGESVGSFISFSGADNPEIEFDVEGLAIFYLPDGNGYLIMSSQGNNSYAVFERGGRNEYITSFTVSEGSIDAAEETDGLDVSNFGFNEEFPGGVFIVQDGFNFDGDSLKSQNFKFVDWRTIAYRIDPDMKIDPLYNPWK